MKPKGDLVEIFGYAPNDLTEDCRLLWKLGACPFTQKGCIKFNHDKSITYGTCSLTSTYGDTIACPNRLYANNYEVVRRVAQDAFDPTLPFYLFHEYIAKRTESNNCIVALGKNSGKEVRAGRSLSMDWVLVRLHHGTLIEYTGIEVQSIDTTGNYRDTWAAYQRFPLDPSQAIPPSSHGLNWANVHKRLIPQLIRKGAVYASSDYVNRGLYFIVPDIVYGKFEEIVGNLPSIENVTKEILTVLTYKLGPPVAPGQVRDLVPVRTIRFYLKDFANRFIESQNIPAARALDKAVLGMFGTS